MEIEKVFSNLVLMNDKTNTYYHVDGLSLQNLFFANNNYFPNCYMFTYSGKNGAPHFDVYEILKFFTEKYNVNKLVYYEKTTDVKVAIQREKNLKKWNREWKLELIKKNNPLFKDLSLEWE